MTGALRAAGVAAETLAAIGITNQRETTLLWDRTERGAHPRAIVWQDRRTADTCAELKDEGQEPRVRERTGLVIDAYFSGTKIAWLLDARRRGARRARGEGSSRSGRSTASSCHRLTLAARRTSTDVTNASRTLLMNLARGEWDPELCAIFRVPQTVLPKIVGSAEEVADARRRRSSPTGIPIAGMAGDQQAALFGQACFAEGDASARTAPARSRS